MDRRSQEAVAVQWGDSGCSGRGRRVAGFWLEQLGEMRVLKPTDLVRKSQGLSLGLWELAGPLRLSQVADEQELRKELWVSV